MQIYHGWAVVAACFVMATFAWGLGLYGASVYLHALTTERAWSVSLISTCVTVLYLVNAAVLPVVGSAIDRHGPRPVVIVGALSLAVGVASLGPATAAWQLYLAFAVMGVGWASLSTTGISATLAPWFDRRQGRVVAIALMGASLGAIAGVPLLLLGIETLGFSRAVLAAGGLTVVMLVPIALIVLRWHTPAQLGLRPDGAGAAPERLPGAAAPIPPRIWTRREAIRSRAFQTVALGFALALGVQVGFLTHHVALVEPTFGPVGAGLVVGATGVAALLGRLALAVVADTMNVRHLAALAIGLQIVGLVAIALAPEPLVLIVASLVIGFGVGNATTLSPIIIRREFGAGAFGAIYGVAATVIQTGIALGPTLFGVLRDLFGDYGPALLTAAVIHLAAIAVILAGARSGCISPAEASTLRTKDR